MQGISIFKQTYAAGASRVVMGFDSAINTYSPYAIGCIVGKSYAMAAVVVNEDSDQWHIVNLKTKNGFDAVAVLGAIDEDAAASIAMRDFGRFKESAMWDNVIATNTGGLKRYIDSPLCVKGRKVFTGEIGAMQDMVAGQKILWDGIYLQSHQGSSRVLLSDMVQHDDESALVEKFDGLNAWLAESDVEVMEFDALVVENYRLEQTMAKLASAMGAASGQGGVSVTNVTQTKAVKLRNSGAIQVGVSFELSDGQAVTAIFNHADSETQKLGLKDTLFSWKWKLNSRDISAAVQPNNFEDVKLDILAGRIMKLVNANSARFQRSQAKKLENEQALADGNARIAEKKATLESLKSEIESLHIQADERSNTNDINIAVSMLKEIYLKNIMIFNQDINDIDAALANPKDTLKKAYYAVNGYTIIDVVNLIGKSTLEEWDKGNQLGYIANQLSLDSLSSKQVAEKFKSENKPLIDELEQARRALIDKKSAALASLDVVQPQDAKNSPIVLTGKELGDFPDTAEGKKQLRAAADDLSMETKISKQDQGVDMSKAVAPVAQEIDIVNLEEMGVVQITEQGSENIYFDKDGREYYAKVQNTEDYPVGEFDLGQYPQGLPRTSAVDPAPDTEEAPMPAINLDAEYLNSIINGFNFAAADLDELESKLEAISERLTPETEGLFEQAAEAFAQYAISLEV